MPRPKSLDGGRWRVFLKEWWNYFFSSHNMVLKISTSHLQHRTGIIFVYMQYWVLQKKHQLGSFVFPRNALLPKNVGGGKGIVLIVLFSFQFGHCCTAVTCFCETFKCDYVSFSAYFGKNGPSVKNWHTSCVVCTCV